MGLPEKYLNAINYIKKNLWLFFIIPIGILAFIQSFNERKGIEQNYTINYATIINSRRNNKQHTKRRYSYEFYYKGVKYNGSSSERKSKNIEIGKIYKVEFSDKNPKQNRIVFDKEYLRKINRDDNGNIIDTTYKSKNLFFKDEVKEIIKNHEIKKDSIKSN